MKRTFVLDLRAHTTAELARGAGRPTQTLALGLHE